MEMLFEGGILLLLEHVDYSCYKLMYNLMVNIEHYVSSLPINIKKRWHLPDWCRELAPAQP